jgi:hypothetical protein
MADPQPPKRGAYPVRILAWIIGGVILGVLLCCGGMFLAATIPPNVYR